MSLTTTDRRATTNSRTQPSTPRLRIDPTAARHTLLDGGWWPRSNDPVAELPGLVLAIDKLHGPVSRLILSRDGWASDPRRLRVAGRTVKIGYFTSQDASLLTAVTNDGDRIDLLVIPAQTAPATAEAAMTMSATSGNRVPAPHILLAVATRTRRPVDRTAQDVWDAEGGHSA
jgi:hypothetical protein